MAISEAQQKAVNKYVKNNYDRINVTFPKGKKAVIQSHAAAKGESVNAFINRAVLETMSRDGSPTAATDSQNEPQIEPHAKPTTIGLPSYLTPDILDRIDKKRFLGGDMSYQLEIGSIIGMDNLSPLADYLRQQSK